MFTPEMMESVKKVEATRASRLGMEPRRMTAEEKDSCFASFIRITARKHLRRSR